MTTLEELKPAAVVRDILLNRNVTVVDVQWHGSAAVGLTCKDTLGRATNRLLFRSAAGQVTWQRMAKR